MYKKLIARSIGISLALVLSLVTYKSVNIDTNNADDTLIINQEKVNKQQVNYQQRSKNSDSNDVYVKASSMFFKQSDFDKQESAYHQWNYQERLRIDNSDMSEDEKRIAHRERRIELAKRGWDVWNQGNVEPAMKVSRILSTLRFEDAKISGTLQPPFDEEFQLVKLMSNYSEDTAQYKKELSAASERCNVYLSTSKSEKITELAKECLSWTDKIH